MHAIFLVLLLAVPMTGNSQELRQLQSPRIKGDVLFISGPIDGHIYEFLSRERRNLAHVRTVELNSYGGKLDWGLLIAARLREMNVITRLSANSVCASACVFLFSAGRERHATRGTWFGIHGARIGGGQVHRFQQACYKSGAFSPQDADCAKIVLSFYAQTATMTDTAFKLMEDHGVSPALRLDYLNMNDDPDWHEAVNILRKPDWVLSVEDAVQYSLVTNLIENMLLVSN